MRWPKYFLLSLIKKINYCIRRWLVPPKRPSLCQTRTGLDINDFYFYQIYIISGSMDWNRISKDHRLPLIPWRFITRMFLMKFSTFLCKSQRLNSKIPINFRKILCSIALLILRKPLEIYMKRQKNYMKSMFGSQGDKWKIVNPQK